MNLPINVTGRFSIGDDVHVDVKKNDRRELTFVFMTEPDTQLLVYPNHGDAVAISSLYDDKRTVHGYMVTVHKRSLLAGKYVKLIAGGGQTVKLFTSSTSALIEYTYNARSQAT